MLGEIHTAQTDQVGLLLGVRHFLAVRIGQQTADQGLAHVGQVLQGSFRPGDQCRAIDSGAARLVDLRIRDRTLAGQGPQPVQHRVTLEMVGLCRGQIGLRLTFPHGQVVRHAGPIGDQTPVQILRQIGQGLVGPAGRGQPCHHLGDVRPNGRDPAAIDPQIVDGRHYLASGDLAADKGQRPDRAGDRCGECDQAGVEDGFAEHAVLQTRQVERGGDGKDRGTDRHPDDLSRVQELRRRRAGLSFHGRWVLPAVLSRRSSIGRMS